MPFELGTVAATELKTRLVTFIETLRPQFPPQRHISVYAYEGSERKGGVRVEIHTRADERQSLTYPDGDGRLVAEEYHRIAIDVKGEGKTGGSEVVEQIFGVLRTALALSAKTESLGAQGIYDLRELPEAANFGEVTFERPLALTCNTDTFIS